MLVPILWDLIQQLVQLTLDPMVFPLPTLWGTLLILTIAVLMQLPPIREAVMLLPVQTVDSVVLQVVQLVQTADSAELPARQVPGLPRPLVLQLVVRVLPPRMELVLEETAIAVVPHPLNTVLQRRRVMLLQFVHKCRELIQLLVQPTLDPMVFPLTTP